MLLWNVSFYQPVHMVPTPRRISSISTAVQKIHLLCLEQLVMTMSVTVSTVLTLFLIMQQFSATNPPSY
jgi:hypothetical protein